VLAELVWIAETRRTTMAFRPSQFLLWLQVWVPQQRLNGQNDRSSATMSPGK